MSTQPNDWTDVNDWQTVGSAPAPSAPSQLNADYVYTNNGYRLNPMNKAAKPNGPITVFTKDGKIESFTLDPKLPASMAPGVIAGKIKTPSVLDRIKSTPLDMVPGMGGQTVGNLAEGFAPALPSARNVLRTVGALGGGAIGAAAGAPTGPGAILSTAAGGAAGASIGESAYQMAQHAMGSGDAPKTGMDAAKLQGGAVVQGALQEGGGAVASAGLGKLSASLAERQVAKVLAPTGNAMKADIAEAASVLAKDMPLGVTDKALLGRINEKVDTLGKGVEDAYAAIRPMGMTVSSAPVVGALTKARDAFMVNGTAIPGLETVVADYTKLIHGIGNNPTLTTDQFRQIKQGWDATINWSRNAQARTPAMEQALTDGANAIRATLHKISPQLEKADAAFSTWKTAQDSLQNKVTSAVGSRNALVSNSTILSGVIGSGVGAAIGGATGAGEGAAAAEAINMLMGTTAYRTASLAIKKQVEDLVAKKAYQKAIGLVLAQTSGGFESHVRGLTVPSNVPGGSH